MARQTLRVTVNARNADEAREYAKLRDPLLDHTVKVQRRAQIVAVDARAELQQGTATFEHPSNISYSSKFWADSARGKR